MRSDCSCAAPAAATVLLVSVIAAVSWLRPHHKARLISRSTFLSAIVGIKFLEADKLPGPQLSSEVQQQRSGAKSSK